MFMYERIDILFVFIVKENKKGQKITLNLT